MRLFAILFLIALMACADCGVNNQQPKPTTPIWTSDLETPGPGKRVKVFEGLLTGFGRAGHIAAIQDAANQWLAERPLLQNVSISPTMSDTRYTLTIVYENPPEEAGKNKK